MDKTILIIPHVRYQPQTNNQPEIRECWIFCTSVDAIICGRETVAESDSRFSSASGDIRKIIVMKSLKSLNSLAIYSLYSLLFTQCLILNALLQSGVPFGSRDFHIANKKPQKVKPSLKTV
jgi:hypothetical protein